MALAQSSASVIFSDEQPEKIIREGYPCEVHLVVTQDCYMLEMHRIPFGKHSPPMPGVHRPAVYLQHGLLGSSAVWVMGTPENSLGNLKDHFNFLIGEDT